MTRQYTQVGIVSGGSCASYTNPGIFARLEHQTILKFIQDNVWDNMPVSNVKIIEKLLKEIEELKKRNLKLEEKIEKISNKEVNTNTQNTRNEKILIENRLSFL